MKTITLYESDAGNTFMTEVEALQDDLRQALASVLNNCPDDRLHAEHLAEKWESWVHQVAKLQSFRAKSGAPPMILSQWADWVGTNKNGPEGVNTCRVLLKFRSGKTTVDSVAAAAFNWKHDGSPADILQYMVVGS